MVHTSLSDSIIKRAHEPDQNWRLQEGVEPTNNITARTRCRAMVWRRRSFDTQSVEGSRVAERLLTVVTILR